MTSVVLNNGLPMPTTGFGTWEIKTEEGKTAVLEALKAGYRLIDTAKIYGNEEAVGEALRESGVPREELFITTKVWNDDQGYDRTIAACKESLAKLGLDYLDLYLIHWPASTKRHESWRALEQLHKDGLVKCIGVSNYTADHLKELAERSDFKPAINQVEFHPFIYDQQQEVLTYCREHGITIEAYSPLSRIASDDHDALNNIAAAHNVSAQQVVLRWCIQHGTVPLPRSTNATHIASNLDIFNFELTEAEMEQINNLSDGERVTWDPAGMGA